MSGGGVPQDNSVELAQMEQQAAREERARRDAADLAARQRWEQQLGSTFNNATTEAEQYFQSRGLDPSEYRGHISQAANRARSNVPDLASNPGTYFDNLGQSVFDTLQSGKRAENLRSINTFAPEGFASRRITNDVDDPFIEAILQEQRGNANTYLSNLRDRGVVTAGGYDAGLRDLDNQSYGAKAKLNELSLGELEKGRSSLSNIANRGRTAASNFELGSTFDPYSYSSEIDTTAADFFANLGNNIRAVAPKALFNTAGLPNIAGAAQGQQNTPFLPGVLAGINDNEEDEDALLRSALSAF